MEEFKVKGYWWLPSNPEDSIAGILTYNGKDKSTLELFGCFKSFDLLHYREFDLDACELIYGVTHRGERFSLLNNICSTFSTSAYEICTFTTNIILEGIYVTDMKQKCFTGELLSFKYLRNWYKKEMVQVRENDDFQIYTCNLNGASNGRLVKLQDGKEVIFIPTYVNAYTKRYDEIHLYQSTQIALTITDLYSVWDFLEKAKILQQFVSLLFFTPQFFDGMSLRLSGNDYYDVKVHVRNEDSIKPFPEAFLKYNIINNKLESILQMWFDCSEAFYPIQSHLFRTIDPNKSVGNEDFLVVAQAIDGMTNMRYNPKWQFEKRVNELYKELEGIRRLKNNKMDTKIFVETRNFYAHMAKGKKHNIVAKGEDLIVLIQRTKLLLTCALLNMYGLSDNEIDECLSHSPFIGWWYLNLEPPTE